MKDEFSDRHQAIKMRLAGQSVEVICQTLERSREWFHTWWRRYQAMGAAGLYDVTRARQSTSLISPELERTILTIRKRLESSLSSTDALRFDWSQRHSSRIESLEYSCGSLCQHHRACVATQWRDLAQSASSAFPAFARIPCTASTRLQSIASGGFGRSDLPERTEATLLHFRLQRRFPEGIGTMSVPSA